MSKILVVDDSKTIRDDLIENLTKDGFTTVEAENGKMGLEVIAQNPDIKLVLCDVNMPIMDGITMCEENHKAGTLKCPIIMLTTEANPELKAKAKSFGVTAWITKPYDITKIVASAKKLIGG